MMPVLPALIACGMINAVLSILTTVGVVSAESGIYTLLYGMGNACMYFLPVLVGSSAAQFFGTDRYIGAVLGAILIYPTFVAAAGAGDALDLLGIKFTMVNYSSTVFPAIVAAWFASVLNKGLRAVPDGCYCRPCLAPCDRPRYSAGELFACGCSAGGLSVQPHPLRRYSRADIRSCYDSPWTPLGPDRAFHQQYYDRRLRSYPWTSLLQHGCRRCLFGVRSPLEGSE